MDFQNVWIPNDKEGFILGKYATMDIGNEGEVTVLPANPRYPSFKTRIDSLCPAEQYDRQVEDNCGLMYLNPASLLNNIRERYKENKIYTYVGNILIAVNPYFDIRDLYTTSRIQCYQGKSIGSLPPHVFAIADKAFRDMRVLKQAQSVIVSGESGAGKTESTKQILRYLCESCGSAAGTIEKKLLEANPVMEAFGNAKTTRNNNSSRFGKFLEVHFDSDCRVVGGFVSHYLLEKSRICTQAAEERNYHVFYLLCAGAPEALRTTLGITKPEDFQYLNIGSNRNFSPIKKFITLKEKSKPSDTEEFNRLDSALSRLGFDVAEKQNIYAMLATVLHLGNIAFEENPHDLKGGCQVSHASSKPLTLAAVHLGIAVSSLQLALVTKLIQSNRGGHRGSLIMVSLKVHEAKNARDALAKAVYSQLFDYIVKRINQSIPFKASSYYIGVLDIAGFEYFTLNSFEQFCINYCNEKLQQFFNERILRDEQDLYEKEQLHVPRTEYRDNEDCIVLIESKSGGIFSLLDEESKLPKHSADHFTAEVHKRWTGHFRLGLPRTSRLRAHREIRDDEGFMIRHFAGAVCYQTSQFIEKNNDALHASLENLILESKNGFLQRLFSTAKKSQQGKLAFNSVGSKFKTQLGELMDKLRTTGTSFIRCIKPNPNMVEHQFEGGSVLSQLESSGMTRVLELMQSGYPSRVSFVELHNMYKSSLKGELSKLNPQMFCKALQEAMGLTSQEYRFGTTKMFFRANMFAVFDSIMKTDAAYLVNMIANVEKWYRRMRWRKVQWCVLAVIKWKRKILVRTRHIITIQKNVKMILTKKQHRPRYVCIWLIKAHEARLMLILSRLQGQSQYENASLGQRHNWQTEYKYLVSEMTSLKLQIRTQPNIQPMKVQQLYVQIVAKVNSFQNLIQTPTNIKDAKPETNLYDIPEIMHTGRPRVVPVIEGLQKTGSPQKLAILRVEMAAQRRAINDSQQKSQAEISNDAQQTLTKKLQLEYARYRNQMEQEKRDYELALRLAQDTNETVEKIKPAPLQNRNFVLKEETQNECRIKKYNLSKLKYAELRDTINTACDIELLQACRIEFHRRLKVFHAWKAQSRGPDQQNQRAPSCVMNAKYFPSAPPLEPLTNTQRYFRVPMSRRNSPTMTGWWYAHFDGQYVARQMELFPRMAPTLLMAGKDDIAMCELSLEETCLANKEGAEIHEYEFNSEWLRHKSVSGNYN